MDKNVLQAKNVTAQKISLAKKAFANVRRTLYSGMKNQLLVVRITNLIFNYRSNLLLKLLYHFKSC